MNEPDPERPKRREELLHRVRVFVYSFRDSRPDYLLLKGAHGRESLWTPLHGSIEFGEQLETAVQREVRVEAGIDRSTELIDLEMPTQFVLGDERVIEWNFGCRAQLDNDDVSLDGPWTDFRWAEFSEAFPALGFEQDRAAILRLHTMLSAA